ncbi:hypothetical protein ACKJSM_21810 [Pseudomonas sp. PHC1]|uniref:hypothetical protein n=1 Tax=Pseudomonas TaxID=286 RepID=UPI0023626BC7|nr:hypothetical protein [Pseudomonas aphyarum]MDD1139244.1 hypothetical protein [Pseudomonas aphyarum]
MLLIYGVGCMKKTRQENVIQAAITGALEAYCRDSRTSLKTFPPYAVQQGDGMRLYCGDLVAMLGNAKILLLEIKELNCKSGVFDQFDGEQFKSCLAYEELGVPIAYSYNAISLPDYDDRSDVERWPELILGRTKRAVPSKLPNKKPDKLNHSSLLDWLRDDQGGDMTAGFGRVLGALERPETLKNGALVLLYGVAEQTLAMLDREQVLLVLNYLDKESKLRPGHYKKIESVLGAAAEVFKGYIKPMISRDNSGGATPGQP